MAMDSEAYILYNYGNKIDFWGSENKKHWSIKYNIDFIILLLVYKTLKNGTPEYISNLLEP
jgi:hypothetical protein